MIKMLALQNFQSHERTQLDLTPGVNIIVGPSDSGKSAIIRALRWLIWNRPQGDSFRSIWGVETTVTVRTDIGDIFRTKGKDNNEYVIRHNNKRRGGDPSFISFKAIGTEVPSEIKTVLNLNEINLQQQLDRPFLLDSTPGEVAQHFNQIAHLDVIDNGTQNVQRWLRSVEQDIKSAEIVKSELEEKLNGFAYLDEFETDVVVLETLENNASKLRNNVYKINELINNIDKINIQIIENSQLLPAEKIIDSILGMMEKSKATDLKNSKLSKFISDFLSCESALEAHQDFIGMEKEVEDILTLIGKRREKVEVINNLFRSQGKLINTVGELAGEQGTVKKLEELFRKNMPNLCPLCNQEVKK